MLILKIILVFIALTACLKIIASGINATQKLMIKTMAQDINKLEIQNNAFYRAIKDTNKLLKQTRDMNNPSVTKLTLEEVIKGFDAMEEAYRRGKNGIHK